ncbi:MAG TPA: hypothetical protein VGR30_01790 [Candidatus Binatia bacterium]|nr:hypothetical protein [Candidatus Binatia bacterium]
MPRWFRRGYRRWARHQLERRGYLDPLSKRPPDANPPDYSDLWFLYNVVRQRKPRSILEFGSGCSTVIMAQALADNLSQSYGEKRGYLYSVDAHPYWAKVTSDSIPKNLREFCEVSYSPLLEISYEGTPAFRHAKIPDVVPDLLYLDGPELTPERQIAVDVLDLEGRLLPGFYMVVDGRKANRDFLLRHLKRRYAYKYRRQFRNAVFALIP